MYCTDKKKNFRIYIIYKEIQMGSGTKSYTRKEGVLYEEMRKYFIIYEEAVSHIHKVLIYIEHHSVCPLVGIGTPPPL
jgi:hypothetical protein